MSSRPGPCTHSFSAITQSERGRTKEVGNHKSRSLVQEQRQVCVDKKRDVAITVPETPGQRLVTCHSLEAQELGLEGHGGPALDSQI
jgi:predicted metalloprotease